MQGSRSWLSVVNLTLSQHGRVISSAHRLSEVNILPKFKAFEGFRRHEVDTICKAQTHELQS